MKDWKPQTTKTTVPEKEVAARIEVNMLDNGYSIRTHYTKDSDNDKSEGRIVIVAAATKEAVVVAVTAMLGLDDEQATAKHNVVQPAAAPQPQPVAQQPSPVASQPMQQPLQPGVRQTVPQPMAGGQIIR